MTRKSIKTMLSAMMAVSVLAGCGGGSSTGGSASSTAASSGSSSGSVADDPAVVLTMAEVNPLDTIVGQMDQKFAEEVERLSGGSVTIDLQASGRAWCGKCHP